MENSFRLLVSSFDTIKVSFCLVVCHRDQFQGEQTFDVMDDSMDCTLYYVDVASFPCLFFVSNYGLALFASPEVDAKEAQRVFKAGEKKYWDNLGAVTIKPNFRKDFSRIAFRRTYDKEGQQYLMRRPYLQAEQVKRWLDEGGDINTTVRKDLVVFRDRSGWSLLMLTILHGEMPTVDLLLDQGADVNIVSSDGMTAIKIAQKIKNFPVLYRLQRSGAVETNTP